MDDGSGGGFVDLYGVTSDTLVISYTASGLTQGNTYGFRYRAKNVYGWGTGWSPVTYILAATVPSTPAAPTFVAATDTQIDLTFSTSVDDGGSTITEYELYMDLGTSGSAFSIVASYTTTSFTMSHSLTTGGDSLTTGLIYSFKWRSKNVMGYSEFSEILTVACNQLPLQANTPTVNYDYSSSTSLFVTWSLNADGTGTGGLITGYKLYMDDGAGGSFTEIFSTLYTSP